MANPSDLSDGLNIAVEMLAAKITEHEFQEHAGQCCRLERMNMIAWVAHRIGWFPRGLQELQALNERIVALLNQCPHRTDTEHYHE